MITKEDFYKAFLMMREADKELQSARDYAAVDDDALRAVLPLIKKRNSARASFEALLSTTKPNCGYRGAGKKLAECPSRPGVRLVAFLTKFNNCFRTC